MTKEKAKVISKLESMGIDYELLDYNRIKFPMLENDPLKNYLVIVNGKRVRLTHKYLGFEAAYRYLMYYTEGITD